MFTIEVKDNGLQAALNALVRRCSNLQPVLQTIGDDIMTRSKARFATGTDPDGGAWKKNAPSTIARKGAGKGPLIGNSGDLRKQFHVTASNNSVTIGNSMVYAAIQQFGGSIQHAAYSKFVRHRTDARGNLLTTAQFNGKGLIFAKDSHKRALARWFQVRAHAINIPARPFLPVHSDGSLYPQEQSKILEQLNRYIAER